MRLSLLSIIGVVLFDQVVKIWVKLSFAYGESVPVFGNWFYLHFIENPGMAFGLELGGVWGKYVLSIVRFLTVGLMIYLLRNYIKKGVSKGAILGLSLVVAGAIGNIIDGSIYGLIFSDSTYHEAAILFPEGGGYAGFLQGRVVDMLYFPLIDSHFPDWFPIWGGEPFQFFRPVFNIADTAVSIGVGLILIFKRNIF